MIPSAYAVFLNEFASLVLGVVKEQIYGETGVLVSKFVKQLNNLRRGD